MWSQPRRGPDAARTTKRKILESLEPKGTPTQRKQQLIVVDNHGVRARSASNGAYFSNVAPEHAVCKVADRAVPDARMRTLGEDVNCRNAIAADGRQRTAAHAHVVEGQAVRAAAPAPACRPRERVAARCRRPFANPPHDVEQRDAQR
mgnify:CR=1 FL=1